MPIDKDRLAYASNHDGRGDLNSLAHTLVVHLKAGRLSKETVTLLCGTYNGLYNKKRGFQPLRTEADLIKKLNYLAPDEVEKEIAPVLEVLLSKDPKKKRLNRFIELANSLGMKVEVYTTEYTEDSEGAPPKKYTDFIPSKKLELTKVKTLTEEIEEAEDGTRLADVAQWWEEAVEQEETDERGEELPKVKLFLKNSSGDSCDYYFEYPDSENAGDFALLHPDDENARREREKLRYKDHNESIQEENENVKTQTLEDDQPYSLGKAFSVLFSGFFGGGFTKLLESIMSVFSPLTQACGPLASAFGLSGAAGEPVTDSMPEVVRSPAKPKVDPTSGSSPEEIEDEEEDPSHSSSSESESDSSPEEEEEHPSRAPSPNFDMFFSERAKGVGKASGKKLREGYEEIPEGPEISEPIRRGGRGLRHYHNYHYD